MNKEPNANGPHLVVLVHGINTWGLWMPVVEPTLQSAGFVVARTSYGHFPVSRFLLPLQALRRRAVERSLRDIRTAIQLHKPAKISAITHSFGTYVVATILKERSDLRWHRIIFCGSVVRDDFPFDEVLGRFQFPLLNEVGTRDFWPALAESITWGFGSVGSNGFNRPPVHSRWHDGYGHSDFLTPDFCRRYWIPFLRDGTIRPSSRPSKLSGPAGMLVAMPLRWMLLGGLFAAAFSLAWWVVT